MTGTVNLKPCPFCGGTVQQVLVSVPASAPSGNAHYMSLEFSGSAAVISCQACGTFNQDPDIWNRRAGGDVGRYIMTPEIAEKMKREIYGALDSNNHSHPLPDHIIALAHQPSEAVPVGAEVDPDREFFPAQNYNCPCIHPSQCNGSCYAAPQPLPPRIDAEAVERERGHYYSEAESGWDAQPTAKDALQAIANLPTGKNESEMAGQEDAYRAVEALFAKPPHIECKDAGAVEWHFNRVREEIKAGRTQNALTYISCGIANARAAKSDDYAKGVRAGIDEALQIAREQAALMADLALEGLPESARQHEAMEAALTRFTSKLNDTLSDLVSTAASLRAAPATEAKEGVAVVAVKPMKLSGGRADYYVSIRCGDREVTPHMFREEYKAAYHVALYQWLLSGGDEPDILAFDEDDFPAQRTALVTPSDARMARLEKALERSEDEFALIQQRITEGQVRRAHETAHMGELGARAALANEEARADG